MFNATFRIWKAHLLLQLRRHRPRPMITALLTVAALLTAAAIPGCFRSPQPSATPSAAVAAEIPTIQPTSQPAASISPDQIQTVTLLTDAQSIVLPLREYLIGVLFAEMPPSFEPEALKAQAVAARTYTLKKLQNSRHNGALCSDIQCCQAYLDPAARAEKFGAEQTQWEKKVEQAVDATDGLVLEYQGALIDATYFSSSGGCTEDAAAVWGSETPYLVSVESPEPEAPYQEETVSIPLDTFCATILDAAPEADLSGAPAGWFGAQTQTPGNGVATLVIGGKSFAGTELRSLFSLRSTRFTVSIAPDAIVFSTSGNGHRVGMSQYGANAMAAAGADFTTILTHYYTGAEIKSAVPTDSEQRSF